MAAHVAARPRKRQRAARLPRSTPLPHLLQMHFIQVKVGKLGNVLPAATLALSFHFASKGPLFTAFESSVCGQMQQVGNDATFLAAAVAAGALPAAAVAPPKTYELVPTFELVTSRRVTDTVKDQLLENKIALTSATDATFWGPRVDAFCAATDFTLFQ